MGLYWKDSSPFTPDLSQIIEGSIVEAVLAYDDCITGGKFVFNVNQALYYSDSFPRILLNPNQM